MLVSSDIIIHHIPVCFFPGDHGDNGLPGPKGERGDKGEQGEPGTVKMVDFNMPILSTLWQLQ